ncbi:LysR family transcriptional regulator [Aureimonas endophytica]|uniref:LysR family transcriptional regulator n=1 Tax=Aureimonas endophytica TaxID=2027858 RepID=A0A916ZP22_9HYPH|nr:LysR family transcriptional regulator [Aureimonas endophytica]GGE06016.1 LysR family transcriptional regulator [Aureimonas endophytica]
MDRLEAMALLREAVDRGSLSAAGRALRVPVPTLSRKISDLETRLGTKLLVRTTRRLTLTDAGIAYLAAARRILDEVESAEREAAGEFSEPKGELVLTAPILFGRLHVLPVVTEFLERFPQIDVRLRLADRNVHLVDDHVDMAVRIGRLADSAMVATRIGTMRVVVAASPALLAKHGVPAVPEDLRGLPVVAVEGPMPEADWRFHPSGGATPVDIALRPRLSVTTTEAAADAAIRGTGIVRLLHYQVVDGVEEGRLRLVLEDFEPEPVPVHLIHATRGQMPLKLRRFLDFAAPALRQRLGKLPPRKGQG